MLRYNKGQVHCNIACRLDQISKLFGYFKGKLSPTCGFAGKLSARVCLCVVKYLMCMMGYFMSMWGHGQVV